MLKIIKKALFLSLFAFSSVFSMRHVAQAMVARTLNQSAHFRNSFAARYPGIFAGVMVHMMAEEATEVEVRADVKENEVAAVIANESVATDHQNITTGNQGLANLNNQCGVEVFENKQRHVTNLSSNSRLAERTFQPQSPNQSIHERSMSNDNQSRQHMSEIVSRFQVEQIKAAFFANIKSELSCGIANRSAIVRNQTENFMQSCSSLSNHDLQNLKANFAQLLFRLKTELQSLMSQCSSIDLVVNPENYGLIPGSIPSNATPQDLCKAKNALVLQLKIELTEAAIPVINCKLEQKVHDFENKLKDASLEAREKEIMQELVAKKEATAVSITQEEHGLNRQDKKLKAIHAEQDLLRKRFQWPKIKQRLEFLSTQEKILEKKREFTYQKLESLKAEQKENNAKIAQVQKVIDEKEHIAEQESQRLQEQQEQEALISHKQQIQNQHGACTFDLANCPDPVLKQPWCDRKDALFVTMEQDFLQYDQEFYLSPQAAAFLQMHGINYSQVHNFHGTALQQQLHSEICDIFEQAAVKQAQLPYQKKLLTSVVEFADAAYDANKNQQILLASQLLDVDYGLLKLSREITTAAMPYVQAAVSAVVHSATDFLHMAAHPIETTKGLGKAIYYVLETAALNCYSEEDGFEDIYIPLRDQRNAEIVAGLKNLGEQMANATGPERFEALVRFGADFVVPGKIIHAVGGVCGAVRSQANIVRAVELATARVGEQVGVEKLAHEIVQTVQKMEQVAQENIAKNVAEELMHVEKQFEKSAKSFVNHSSEAIKQFQETLADFLKDLTAGKVTKGRAQQYIKHGSYEDAIKDFYSLKPSNVRNMSGKEGKLGTLPDGRTVNVRMKSEYGTPTLQIQPAKGITSRDIKIRYENKNTFKG